MARGEPAGGRSLSGLGIRPSCATLGALDDLGVLGVLGVLGDLEREGEGGGVEVGDVGDDGARKFEAEEQLEDRGVEAKVSG